MSESAIDYQGTVYPWQCDHMGHMNVMWYAGKFDEASWNYFARIGMTPKYLTENNRGMAALEQTTKYMKEVHAGDTLSVRTLTIDLGDKTVRFEHEMSDTSCGDVIATTKIVAVHINTDLRKSISLPDDVRQKAELLLK